MAKNTVPKHRALVRVSVRVSSKAKQQPPNFFADLRLVDDPDVVGAGEMLALENGVPEAAANELAPAQDLVYVAVLGLGGGDCNEDGAAGLGHVVVAQMAAVGAAMADGGLNISQVASGGAGMR